MPKIIFINKDGSKTEVDAKNDTSVLEIAHENNIEIEGQCGGSLACSTCHVYVDKDWYSKLAPASEDEEDMLDLEYNLTKYSRLCCQIIMKDTLDGIKVSIPSGTTNHSFK